MAAGGGADAEDMLEERLRVGEDWFVDYPAQDDRKPNLYGFARFRALEGDIFKDSTPKFKSKSRNIPMLRSLAVAHFYQSNFSACHDLLKKITDMIRSEELEPSDLGLLLMVAECELARGGIHIKEAVNDLVELKTSVTMQNIMALDAELVKSRRFVGGLLIQYLAFRKETDKNPSRSDERKRFVRVSLGRICYRLARAKRVGLHLTKDSLDCLVGILNELLKELEGFGLTDDTIQSYAAALCHNCLSWCHLSAGSRCRKATQHAEKGTAILCDLKCYVYVDPAFRMLFGDLRTNQGIAKLKSEGAKAERLKGAHDLAKKAIAAYKKCDDYRNAEDDFMRETQPRGEWAEWFKNTFSHEL